MEHDADLYPPSLTDFEAMAFEALGSLPENFLEKLGTLIVHVSDFADAQTLDEMDIDDPFELTGLYHGVSLIHDSISDPSPQPARVFLYRRPILDEWAERGDVGLRELIAHVMIHEIGHHFGWSDEEMDRLLDED